MDERPFDADNHYYEALDAFTRHLDPKLGPRVVQWATIDGKQYQVLGGRVCRAVTNPTFDPVAKPGVLADYFRGNPNAANPLERLREHEPIRACYRDPAARLAQLDEHGLSAAWLFPTLGMIYEEPLKHDPEAVTLLFTAFNRWLEEDWGFAHDGRLAPDFRRLSAEERRLLAAFLFGLKASPGSPNYPVPPEAGRDRRVE